MPPSRLLLLTLLTLVAFAANSVSAVWRCSKSAWIRRCSPCCA